MGFEIINKIKKERGLTNAQISAMSGVTLSTLDKITSGANTNPKLDTLQAICRVLGCTLDDFDDFHPVRNLTSDEWSHIKKYRALDTYGQDTVSAVLDCEYKRCTEQCPMIQAAARGGGVKRIKEIRPDELPTDGEPLP